MLRRFAPVILSALTFLLALALTAGFFGRVHAAFDSFSHLRLHLAVLLALAGVPLLFTSLRLHGALALALGAAAAWTCAAGMGWTGKTGLSPRPDDRAVYRLLQLNLRYDNETPEQVLSLIARIQPDIMTLNEVSVDWAPRLDLIEAAYPYRILCTAPRRIGAVAILSRRPLAEPAPRCLDRGAMAFARIGLGDGILSVAALHLGWPWPFGQDWQLYNDVPLLAEFGPDAILAGDFNAVSWSETVRRVAAEAGFRPVIGIGPSWLSAKLPEALRPAGLPIDQAMAKGRVRIHSATRLEPVGSDHLPVLVEFSLAPQPTPRPRHEPGETKMVARETIPEG